MPQHDTDRSGQPGLTRVPEDKIAAVIQGVPGLILGPAFTYHPGIIRDVITAVSGRFNVPATNDLYALCDSVKDEGHDEPELIKSIRSFLESRSASAQLSLLTQVAW